MPKTVLLVEDDPDTRAIYGTALIARGYRVLTATQGAEGVSLARRHRPDIILMDIRMPVMDGWHAMRYLRSYYRTASIPVCAVSAYAPEAEEVAAVEALGFQGFLIKPIPPKELVTEVEDRIGPPRAHA